VSHVQLCGGFFEAAEPARSLEDPQGIERRQYPFHLQEFF
jgi:hypothetical protein